MPSTVTLEGIEFTRYVQSTFKVRGMGLVLWLDPHRVTEREVGEERADLVLITHPHGDHLDPASLRACAKEGSVLVTNPVVEGQLPPEVRRAYTVVTLRAGQSTEQKGVSIRAVPGYNRYHPKEQGFNTGFLFTLAGKTIYHAGDTNKVPEMGEMGPVDIALYPIGGTYTSDEAEAAEAVRDLIKPRWAIPMHYGYATGGDPERFRALVGGAVRVEVLEPVLKGARWGA